MNGFSCIRRRLESLVRRDRIESSCTKLEKRLPLTSYEILEKFDLLDGHPWSSTAKDKGTTYYACLYGAVQPEQPSKVLEIGTAFGLSSATLLKACRPIELFVSMDLGIYGKQLGATMDNIEFAKSHIHDWCHRNNINSDRVRFYRANTQPSGCGDNDNSGTDVTRWASIPEIIRLLQWNEFDVIFVDGKHTEEGLLNDLNTFWSFLRPGGLVVCDDLHDPIEYAGIFPWAGDTWRSFHIFLEKKNREIADYYVWDYPRVPPPGKLGLRPFGFVRKGSRTPYRPRHVSTGFETFDAPEAMDINRARQDHLASLGLDLTRQSVLEVGAGVGWHTAFFEKLGCVVLSTDGRPENVCEHLRRYPHRKGRVKVADLTAPGSHSHFGKFDIVYCYGTLYHLNNPELCIRDLSKICLRLFLLETCVNPVDNNAVDLVSESKSNPNQSMYGQGCRPSRDWIIEELRKRFPYVYLTCTQPNHVEFPINWPETLEPNVQNARAVFVASMKQLDLPTLSSGLTSHQERIRNIDTHMISITPESIGKPRTLMAD